MVNDEGILFTCKLCGYWLNGGWAEWLGVSENKVD